MLSATLEQKAFFQSTGVVSATTAGAVYSLSNVAQGVTHIDRVGDQLSKKNLQLMYSITAGATGLIAAADEFNTVRVIIFTWREDDGLTAPTPGLVLQLGVATANTNALHNYDTRHDYSVVYDHQHIVYNSPLYNGSAVAWHHGVGSNFALVRPVTFKLSGKINFDADTTFGTDKLYALVISDSAFTPDPTIEINTRLLFEDG